jgi:hypothetical protein
MCEVTAASVDLCLEVADPLRQQPPHVRLRLAPTAGSVVPPGQPGREITRREGEIARDRAGHRRKIGGIAGDRARQREIVGSERDQQ